MPLAVEYPTLLTHETKLVLPEPYPLDEAPLDLADGTAALHFFAVSGQLTRAGPHVGVAATNSAEGKRDCHAAPVAVGLNAPW
jgi:hypothetical protein